MTLTHDRIVDIVDHHLGLHVDVDGRYEWVDRTTRTRSFEWQIHPKENDRRSVGGECYLMFRREDLRSVVELRVTVEFADIDRVRNTELLERAKHHDERANVEYRIVEEFADRRQRFHVIVGASLFYESEHLEREEDVRLDVDQTFGVLAELCDEVDRMVYMGSGDSRSGS